MNSTPLANDFEALRFLAPLIPCPKCDTAIAYLPALLGKTTRCRQCAHAFAVGLPRASLDSSPELAVATTGSRLLTPPPLPVRGARPRTIPPVPKDRARIDPASNREEPDDSRSRRRRPEHDRPTGAGVLAGLVAVSFLGIVVLLAGVMFLLWPEPDRTTAPNTQGPSPPSQAPVADEPQKNLKDILNDVPARGSGEPKRPERPR